MNNCKKDIFELMRTEEGRKTFQEETNRRVKLIEEDRKKYGFYYPENPDVNYDRKNI